MIRYELVIMVKNRSEQVHRVLLTRASGSAVLGQWSVPGGPPLPDDRDVDAAVERIAREFLGARSAKVVMRVGSKHWKGGAEDNISIFFMCRTAEQVISQDFKNMSYFLLDRLPQDMVPPHREYLLFLEALLEDLGTETAQSNS